MPRIILILSLLLLIHISLTGQPKNPVGKIFPREQLLPLRNGYLGILRERRITQLTRYSKDFRDVMTVAFDGLSVVQDALVRPGRGDPAALLLASPLGRAALFNLACADTLSLQPIWQSKLPPMRKIVSIDRHGIALVGDSAFVMIGPDSKERFVRTGEMLDAIALPSDSDRVLLAMRDRPNVVLMLIDPASGATLALHELGDCERVLLRWCGDGDRSRLAVVTIGSVSTGYMLDVKTLRVLGRCPLPGMPIGLACLRINDRAEIAAIFAAYPAPSSISLSSSDGGALRPIDYPLVQPVISIAQADDQIAFIGQDSTTFYDRRLKLIESVPSVGIGTDVRITRLDSARLLMSSPPGSRVVLLGQNAYSWFGRNWQLLALVGIIGFILYLLLLFIRRHRFLDVVYRTLVRVPSSNGVIIVVGSQKVRHINSSARMLLGIAPIIPLGRHVTEYLVGDELAGVVAAVRRLCSAGETFEVRTDVPREGQLLTLLFRGRPMIGQFGLAAGYLLTVEDITRTLERERLVNWASVAHHIAHEMKTPLGTMRLTAETLRSILEERDASGDEVHSLERIIYQSERLRGIVDDLMKIARAELLDRSEADISVVMRLLADEFFEYLPSTAMLLYETQGDDFRCNVDAGQLVVAVRNLLDNARQAIGGRVGGEIKLAVHATDTVMTISVRDNGVGMSTSTLAKIFQPFYTEREGGSGIGTVIVKRIVEAHEGAVNAESRLGEGTVFTVKLPRK